MPSQRIYYNRDKKDTNVMFTKIDTGNGKNISTIVSQMIKVDSKK